MNIIDIIRSIHLGNKEINTKAPLSKGITRGEFEMLKVIKRNKDKKPTKKGCNCA